ncbi:MULTISPECIES: conjugal transfer protein TrbL family protein [Paenibacillaceae]|uniref:conjugal transfer protein TrbL family protein n=1 Tax=Paenibacillaceae TaxID=186822 RepID=UPI001E4B3467|nr:MULTISPECIES: conjugal transfer protein TrbL family protein [Paenibacillaceae]
MRKLEAILVVLIVAILNGALIYIDTLLKDIIPMTLYAERSMTALSGGNIADSLFDILFGFGVSLIILKFLKKGFEIYVMWSDGDPDEEPLSLLTNFFKAMAVAICFPTIYLWLGQIVEELTDKLLVALGQSTNYDWNAWVSGISSLGLVTAIFGLIFIICYFILYFQFLMRGLEILILRIGVPLACVGLLDNDKGVFKAYSQKFAQSTLAVVVQITLAKLGVGLMLNMHIFWGLACMVLAIRTPRFLSDFLITTGGNGGVVNNVYHSVRLVGMARKMLMKTG